MPLLTETSMPFLLHTLIRTLAVFAVAVATAIAAPLPFGKSDFSFEDPHSNLGKPVTAWVYKPAHATRDSRLVFVMTGVKRNGETYRNNWIRHAERHNFILAVPVFSRQHYTHADDYTFGGVTTRERAQWGFQTLERLFDALRARDGLTATHYSLYGHSAGAQFVHRLVLFMGDAARYDTAFAANAGWYTLPAYDQRHPFPLSLDQRVTPESALKSTFARKLVILLGDQDIDPAHPALNRSPFAMTQGAHRLARGQHFYALAKNQAASLSAQFSWEMRFVPGVAHSDRGMSEAAVKYLFDD